MNGLYLTCDEETSDCECSEGEGGPLVVDFGSGSVKAGFAGDDAPRAVIPAVVGRAKDWAFSTRMRAKRSLLVGEQARIKRGVMKLTHPVERGVVTYWGDAEAVYRHTLQDELRAETAEHPVLVTEPVLNP